MEAEAEALRSGVVEMLELLADPAAQRTYERDAPLADAPAELICGWFDDLYHPSTAPFVAAFAERERQALAAFHAIFAQHVDALPCDNGVHALQGDPRWSEITQAAAAARRALGAVS